MTNTALQAMVTTFGDRMFCINFDNTRFIYIGYKNGVPLTDISFETIEGVDFVVVSKKDPNPSKDVFYKIYHLTETVQWVGIMDENSVDYRVDPLILR